MIQDKRENRHHHLMKNISLLSDITLLHTGFIPNKDDLEDCLMYGMNYQM